MIKVNKGPDFSVLSSYEEAAEIMKTTDCLIEKCTFNKLITVTIKIVKEKRSFRFEKLNQTFNKIE